MDQLGVRTRRGELGIGASPCAAAVGSIIAHVARPGSERAARRWLGDRSALGELLGGGLPDPGADAALSRLRRVGHQLCPRRNPQDHRAADPSTPTRSATFPSRASQMVDTERLVQTHVEFGPSGGRVFRARLPRPPTWSGASRACAHCMKTAPDPRPSRPGSARRFHTCIRTCPDPGPRGRPCRKATFPSAASALSPVRLRTTAFRGGWSAAVTCCTVRDRHATLGDPGL